MQNLSLAFRDPVGSAAVNILPSEKPSDIYQLVADKTVIRLKEIAEQKCSLSKNAQEDDRPSDAALAQWWLDFGVTRKITKRNCMTFPYGCVKMS
ncbi:DNA-directed RNA polymerase [uncultured Amphritea sp.]|uniref:DNA-directed RNA polymerase n=1 Tax=uncultured Amphritea sp. TaxID=981605 RepID=UPI00344DDE0E